MKNIVGIDLGTTFSAISKLNELGKPSIVPNSDGERITASAIYFSDDIIVGNHAINLYSENPNNLARWIKREMGEEYYSKEIMNKKWTPIELSSLILKKLKNDFEEKNGEVNHCAISVPAYFDEIRRNATIEAGRMAGLNVVGIINEPTAAAIYYGKEYDINGKTMVLDLGGGTFDVTLLNVKGENIDIICSRGDHRLGGYDFDQALAQLIADKLKLENTDEFINDSDVLVKVENYKKRLSKSKKVKIQMFWRKNAYEVSVTREEFVSCVSSYLARIELLAEDLLDEANIDKKSLDNIVFVGGSTRIPKLAEIIEETFNLSPKVIGNVDECVSLGSAIYAGLKVLKNNPDDVSLIARKEIEKTNLSEVCNHSYGTIVISFDEDFQRNLLKNDIIIPKNTKIPHTSTKTYYTTHKNQNELEFKLTQGESDDIDFVNILHREIMQLPQNREANLPVKVEYTYNSDGMMKCNVTDIQSGRNKTINISVNNSSNDNLDSNEKILDMFNIE